MYGRSFQPTTVDVIAHLLDMLGNLMCPNGGVFAATDFNIGRAKITRILAYTLKSYPMQVQEVGDPELERAFRITKIFHHLHNGVELREAVLGFSSRTKIWIGN